MQSIVGSLEEESTGQCISHYQLSIPFNPGGHMCTEQPYTYGGNITLPPPLGCSPNSGGLDSRLLNIWS